MLTTSPSETCSARRTASFSGITYRPFFGQSDVVNVVAPSRPFTGIIPQP